MMQTKKDIFGNVYNVPVAKPMSFAQKYREAKAKERYKKYQAEQRAKQIETLKRTAQRSRQGLQKTGEIIKAGYKRATDSRLTSLRDKVRGSIYKKE